jgi:serine protease Do
VDPRQRARPRKAPSGTSRKRALVLAVLTAGGVMALYVAISVVMHLVRTLRVRSAMRQAIAEAEAPPAVVVPSIAPSEEPPTVAPPVILAPLSSRELAKQSLPATVSLRCNESIGSGFFVEPDLVLTNAHVLCPMGEKVQVVLSDGSQMAGETVRSNEAVDLALVRVPRAGARTLPLGDVGDLELGDRIMVIGSPVGLEFTVHEGIVSHVGRVVQGVAYIQLDAKVNPGNSGGPIIDDRGRVVGVVTLKLGQAEGISLALPINYAYSPELGYVNPPSLEAADSAPFKGMMATATQKGGLQLPSTQGVSIEVRPLLGAIDYDQYRRFVLRVLRVQDAPPPYEEITVKVWSSAEHVCTLKGDIFKWKEVDPDQAGSGIPDEMLRGLKRLGATHIFMGESALGWQSCDPARMGYNIELELVGGNPISNRMHLMRY